MTEIPFTDGDSLITTLTHHIGDKHRSEVDLEVFKSNSDGLCIDYTHNQEEIQLYIDSNHLYLECIDIDGLEHKIRLL